ncbi:hypothetical protein [Xanthobacter agilis]|uniref:Uncharacterized protein n=1 Tax=Xanthobacter agilis TaxID=47492 RepID=A0ABU0LG54_XANAG|nr:hypothetical protein [Xanthobacter agilis]MDQ0506124.1 hypothetical protein [Xanthobacter agilis]
MQMVRQGVRSRGGRVVRGAGVALAVVGFALAALPAASAQTFGAFDFVAPPSAEANRVYGVNRKTGELSACQFERPAGSSVGVTRCFALGEGAGAQKAGRYGLLATHYAGETGVFRVNYETGEMSICYVRDLPRADGKVEPTVLCTPQGR